MSFLKHCECGNLFLRCDAVHVSNVLVCCSIPDEDAFIDVVVEFSCLFAGHLTQDPAAKCMQTGEVWLHSKMPLMRRHVDGAVYCPVVEVDSVENRVCLKCQGKARHVQQPPCNTSYRLIWAFS